MDQASYSLRLLLRSGKTPLKTSLLKVPVRYVIPKKRLEREALWFAFCGVLFLDFHYVYSSLVSLLSIFFALKKKKIEQKRPWKTKKKPKIVRGKIFQ